jgi:hypothetical protein
MSWEAWVDSPEYPCEICGCNTYDCICPECPVCGVCGDPKCYEQHGMVMTEEQIASAHQHDPENLGPD